MSNIPKSNRYTLIKMSVLEVFELDGEDFFPEGIVEDQDKFSYFFLSSHHSQRRNTNWDCSAELRQFIVDSKGYRGWLSVCLTAWGRRLTLLMRKGRVTESEWPQQIIPGCLHYQHQQAKNWSKWKNSFKIIKTNGKSMTDKF